MCISLARIGLSAAKPVFRLSDGKCLTGANLNTKIKGFLGKYVDYDKKRFLSHSFRAGMASMMTAAGYRDKEIMRQGIGKKTC